MRMRSVPKGHYLLGSQSRGPKQLSNAGIAFWNAYLGCLANQAVIVTDKGKCVGFFRFYVGFRELDGSGTFVNASYRRMGLGRKMWMYALKKWKPKKVVVNTIRKSSARLVFSLRKQFPEIKWIQYPKWEELEYQVFDEDYNARREGADTP